jgi:radical SAM protein with 4Fe4S-binding SPASM domain
MFSGYRDILNMFSKISFRRSLNFLKVLSGYYLSRISNQPVVFGTPVSISMEPTTSCNLRCPECVSGLRAFTRPTGMMNEVLFKKLTDEIHKDLFYMIFYFQGEPFLNRELLKMISYAASKKIYTSTSTNAHYFTDETARQTVESGLDRLIISIDGTTQEVYEQYRKGGSLDKVIEGTRNIIKWKTKLKSKKPFVILQYLVVRPNEHQVTDAKKLSKELGVDKIVFKTAQVNDLMNDFHLIPKTEKYSRYSRNASGNFEIKNKLLNHCWRLWHSAVITWDGKSVPCCFDKNAQYTMGNVLDSGFLPIWKSISYNNFRKSVLKSRKSNDICTNCSEGTTVFN